MNVHDKANLVLSSLEKGETLKNIRSGLDLSENEWVRVSAEVYRLHLEQAREKRTKDEAAPNVACTSNEEVVGILRLNEVLSNVALCLPPESTMADYRKLKDLVAGDTLDENILLPALEEIAMAPRMRALQQKGRFEALPIFKGCAAIIEAGVVSYYRENYISAYLTLVPVVEGVILRWLGYSGQGGKPSFKQVKRFIANSYRRQPCPGNPLFHEIYVTVADKLLTEHLFKPSGDGEAHANFNRHLASHLLNDSQFGTKENCVRLCLLLDVMSELYIYEVYCQDPRFYLSGEEVQLKCEAYIQASMDRAGFCTPERKLLIKKNANKAMETDASKAGVANG